MREKYVVIITFFILVLLAAFTASFLHIRKSNKETLELLNNNLYLNGENYVTIEYGSDYIDEGFTSTILKNQSPLDVKIDNNIDIDNIGEYTIKYTVKYKNQTKTLTRTIKIIDTVAPTIKVDCDKNIYVAKNSSLKECKYTVTDNYDKNIENNVRVVSNVNLTKKGDYTVDYIATDSSGNTATQTINVHVRNKHELNYIVIYLSKQKLYYYVNKKVVLSTPITSGRNNYTKTGSFKVWKKARNTKLKGKDYESEVKYWMAYNGNSFGIHDASWRRRFGTMDYKWVGSHGCINVPTKAMKKLYNMVEVGTPVYIKK